MNTNSSPIVDEHQDAATLPSDQLKSDVLGNPVVQRALRRMKESQGRDNHVSHHTKHSSYSTKHSSSW